MPRTVQFRPLSDPGLGRKANRRRAGRWARRPADWTNVADALGKSDTEMPGGVYRVGLPRTDLHVTLDGVQINPTLALGSWLAFSTMGDQAMVMGDLVLTEAEVKPAMKKLTESGIEITALHSQTLRGASGVT